MGMPKIQVKIEYEGHEATHYGAHFIDAISFLCQAEAAIRRGAKLDTPVDVVSEQIGRENLKKLLGENHGQHKGTVGV